MANPKSNMLEMSYVKTEPRSSNKSRFKTFQEAIEYFSKTNPEGEAVVFASIHMSREVVTWGELCKQSKHIARGLIELGIKKHEIVVVNVRPGPEWLFITFGAMFAGAIPVSVSFTYTDGSDVVTLMQKLGKCAMIVVDPGTNDEQWNILNKLLDEYSADGNVRSRKMSYLRHLIVTQCPTNVKDVNTLEQLMATVTLKDVKFPEITEDDVAALFQTSGSTGVPKLVAHTYKSFGAALTYDTDDAEKKHLYEDVIYNDRPFGWLGGFPYNIWLGQTRVTISGKCPPTQDKIGLVIDVIRRERCAIVVTLPPQLHELTQRKNDLGDDWSVKCITSGGQPITKSKAISGCSIGQSFASGYGSTETQFVSAIIVEDADDFKDNTAGNISPGIELKVVDADGTIVPVNTRGTIHLRSKYMFKEYWNDPEKTKAVKSADGWYNTDDIGKLDKDGTLYVFGRQSNMILSGGMNIDPEIIENVIKSCADVDVVLVVPVPDDVMYQVICACVIIKPGSRTNEQEIRLFCEKKHSDKEGLFTVLPKFYMILESFPETYSGKYSRVQLSAMAIARFKS